MSGSRTIKPMCFAVVAALTGFPALAEELPPGEAAVSEAPDDGATLGIIRVPDKPIVLPTREPAPVRLDSVMVKGEKLNRALADTASSVSVTTGKQIENYGDQNLYDLARRVANVLADDDGSISLRGVNSLGAQGYGSPSSAPVISIYVDGIALDPTAVGGNAVDVFDVEQVEILRGPQSTSQGRNALAGAVVSTTRDPTPYWDLLGRMRIATEGSRQYALAGGGPLSDAFGFRLAANRVEDDGDLVNITRNDGHWDRSVNELARLKLALTPASIAGLKSVVAISRTRTDAAPDTLFIADSARDSTRRKATDNEPYRYINESTLVSWRNEYVLTPVFSLSGTTGFIDTTGDLAQDFDQTARDGGSTTLDLKGRNLSQELRLNAKAWGRVTGSVGVYATSFEDRRDYVLRDLQVPLSAVLPVPGAGQVVARIDTTSLASNKGDNLALFGEVDIQLSEPLTLTLGLRYDREQRETSVLYSIDRADAYLFGNETVPGINVLPVLVAADLLPTTDGTQRATGKYSALLPKIGLRYRLAPEWTLFATYSEAYRAGGAEVLRGQGTINEFKPEYTRNYEVGFRATPWQKVGINLNVYHVDWRDQQVATIDSDDGFDYSTKNAANSVLDGAELETRWQPLRGLELYLSSGYAHTRFKDFVDNGQDFSGNQFVDAPRFSGSVGGSYRHRTGAFVSLSYSSTAAYYSSPANAADERGDIRRLLDARLGYQGQRLAAYLYGRNLLDDDTVKSSVRTTTGLGITEEGRFVSYGTLRRLGVQLEARF